MTRRTVLALVVVCLLTASGIALGVTHRPSGTIEHSSIRGTEAASSVTSNVTSGASTSNAANGTTGNGVSSGTTTTGSATTSSPRNVGTPQSPPSQQRGSGRTTGSTNGSSPHFKVVSADSNVPVGKTGNLSITIENTGADVRNASVSVESGNDSLLFGGANNTSQFVGSWAAGERRTVNVNLSVLNETPVRAYPLDLFVSYAAANGSQAGASRSRPQSRAGPYTFSVTPTNRTRLDRFELQSVTSTVQAGDTGTVTLTLENTGRDATDVIVTLQSANGQLSLGQSPNASRFVSTWSSNEYRSFQYHVTASNDTVAGNYPFVVRISYLDNGTRRQTAPRTIGVVPASEQSFSLGPLNSSLRVGTDGTVRGTVTNEGPQTARHAVLDLSTGGQQGSQNVFPKDTEYALGTLAPGESAHFKYRIEVNDNAEPGSRQLSFAVRYQNQNGDPRRSKSLDGRVDVHPRRDEFVVESRNSTVESGSSATVTLVVRNNVGYTLRNVDAQAFANSPLSLSSDEAFVTRLEPNGSTRISFEVAADGSAVAGTYPLSVDFQYDTPNGTTKLSDTYNVPVRVTKPRGNGLGSLVSGGGTIAILALVLVALLVVGFVIRRWR